MLLLLLVFSLFVPLPLRHSLAHSHTLAFSLVRSRKLQVSVHTICTFFFFSITSVTLLTNKKRKKRITGVLNIYCSYDFFFCVTDLIPKAKQTKKRDFNKKIVVAEFWFCTKLSKWKVKTYIHIMFVQCKFVWDKKIENTRIRSTTGIQFDLIDFGFKWISFVVPIPSHYSFSILSLWYPCVSASAEYACVYVCL